MQGVCKRAQKFRLHAMPSFLGTMWFVTSGCLRVVLCNTSLLLPVLTTMFQCRDKRGVAGFLKHLTEDNSSTLLTNGCPLDCGTIHAGKFLWILAGYFVCYEACDDTSLIRRQMLPAASCASLAEHLKCAKACLHDGQTFQKSLDYMLAVVTDA